MKVLKQNVELLLSNNKKLIGAQNSNTETSNFLHTIRKSRVDRYDQNSSEVTGNILYWLQQALNQT